MDEVDDTALIERINELTGREFEVFVASLWELQGWTTEITETRGDDGQDIVAERNLPYEVTIKIQVKRWSEANVPAPMIREYALLPGEDADHAVVVTSSSFTDPAVATARRHDVKLVDRSRLVRLVRKLEAQALLTEEYDVADWEAVKTESHIDWTVEYLGDGEPVDVLPGIGRIRAETLEGAGIHSVNSLLVADPELLAEETGFAESQLQRWIDLAALIRGGERPDVMDGIDQRAVTALADADIYTVDDLAAAWPKDIAAQTALDERTLKLWVGEAVQRNVELVTEFPKIGNERAKALAKAGILTVSDLADADPDAVAKEVDIGEAFLRDRIRKARAEGRG